MSRSARERIVQLLEDMQETDAEPRSPQGIGPEAMHPGIELSGIAFQGEISASDLDDPNLLTDVTADEDTDGEPVLRRGGARGRSSGYLHERIEAEYRSRIADLELKLSEQARERAAAEIAAEKEIAARDHEVDSLRAQLDTELKELMQRQAQVEASAPLMTGQLRAVKEQLSNLAITDAQRVQILQIPQDQRPLVDDVKLAVFEAQKAAAEEIAELRASLSSAREAAARSEQDAAHLKRENARISAAVVEREKDADGQVAAMQARCERLSAELEDAAVRAEVLAAKGTMYDDLRAKCDKLEDENQQLASARAALKQAQLDVEDGRRAHRDREHTLEMLMMDKAYLSKEVETLSDRERRLEADLESRNEKISALKQARQELYEKLLAGETGEAGKYERRLNDEIGRIQAEASAHIERIRRESTEMFERETRMLRELRDGAQQDAASRASALKALQQQYDDLLLQHRDLQKRSDLRVTELQGEARLQAFELDRLRVEAEEKAAALKQAVLQADMLQEKARVLTENYYTLEADKHRRTADLESQLVACQERLGQYERMENDIDSAVLRGDGDRDVPALLDSALPLAVRRRVQQSLQLAARVSCLEAERLELVKQKDTAQGRCQVLESDLAALRQRTRLVGQPQSMFLERLEDADRKSRELEVKLQEAQTAERRAKEELRDFQERFDDKENQCQALAHEKAEMRKDLERVLDERKQLDSMRELLSSAVRATQGRQGFQERRGGRDHAAGPSPWHPSAGGQAGAAGRGARSGNPQAARRVAGPLQAGRAPRVASRAPGRG